MDALSRIICNADQLTNIRSIQKIAREDAEEEVLPVTEVKRMKQYLIKEQRNKNINVQRMQCTRLFTLAIFQKKVL